VIDRLALFGAPTSRAAHTGGQEKAPAVLRRAGLVGLLNARGFDVADLGDLPVARFSPDRVSPRAQNAADVVTIARDVAALVERAVGERRTVLALGGDCTIALGALSGLHRAGRAPALVSFDAHGDLNVPTSVPYGALDWMGLAHALALPGAVAELVKLGPHAPLIEPARLRLLGTVRHQLTSFEQQAIEDQSLTVIDAESVAADPVHAARLAREGLEGPDDALWIHFDVDAIDSVDLPVADFYQLNGGLPYDTVLEALETLMASPALVGMSVSQFNPDHTGPGDANRFVRGLVKALKRGRLAARPAVAAGA
jgi:arginase